MLALELIGHDDVRRLARAHPPRAEPHAPEAVLQHLRHAELRRPARTISAPSSLPRFTLRTLAPGETLVSEGDPSRNVFVVKSGLVGVWLEKPEGGSWLVRCCFPGWLLGESSVLGAVGRARCMASLRAERVSEVWRIHAAIRAIDGRSFSRSAERIAETKQIHRIDSFFSMHETMGQLDVQVRDEMLSCIQRLETFDTETLLLPANEIPSVACLVARGSIALFEAGNTRSPHRRRRGRLLLRSARRDPSHRAERRCDRAARHDRGVLRGHAAAEALRAKPRARRRSARTASASRLASSKKSAEDRGRRGRSAEADRGARRGSAEELRARTRRRSARPAKKARPPARPRRREEGRSVIGAVFALLARTRDVLNRLTIGGPQQLRVLPMLNLFSTLRRRGQGPFRPRRFSPRTSGSSHASRHLVAQRAQRGDDLERGPALLRIHRQRANEQAIEVVRGGGLRGRAVHRVHELDEPIDAERGCRWRHFQIITASRNTSSPRRRRRACCALPVA